MTEKHCCIITKMWGNKIDNWLIGEINDNFMHSCPLVVCIQVSAWQISLLLTLLQGDKEAAKKKSHVICKGFASKKTGGLAYRTSVMIFHVFLHKHSCQNFQSKGRNFEDARIKKP